MKNLVNLHSTIQKSENVTSMGSFRPKYIMLELKKEDFSLMTLNYLWKNTDLVSKMAREIE